MSRGCNRRENEAWARNTPRMQSIGQSHKETATRKIYGAGHLGLGRLPPTAVAPRAAWPARCAPNMHPQPPRPYRRRLRIPMAGPVN